jgi:hypothetical protein
MAENCSCSLAQAETASSSPSALEVGLASLSGLLALILLVVALVVAAWRHHLHAHFHHKHVMFRLSDSGKKPSLPPPTEWKYHLFMSHTWKTGQDQVAVIKRQLLQLLPSPRIFLDVDDLEHFDELESHIRESAVMLLFLSRGYFYSRACLMEVRVALALNKPLVLVHEADTKHGGAELEAIISECPEGLRGRIFRTGREIICWRRTRDLQMCSLRLIAESLLSNTSSVRGLVESSSVTSVSPLTPAKDPLTGSTMTAPTSSSGPPQAVSLYLPGSITRHPLQLTKPVRLLTSKQNTGAKRLGETLLAKHEAHARLVGISHRDACLSLASVAAERELESSLKVAARTGQHVCMLLLLDRETFSVEREESVALANQVRLSRSWGVHLLLMHDEESCEFETIMLSTPDDLVMQGVYKHIAVPLCRRSAAEQEVSLLLAFKDLHQNVRHPPKPPSATARVWRGHLMGLARKSTFNSGGSSTRSSTNILLGAPRDSAGDGRGRETETRLTQGRRQTVVREWSTLVQRRAKRASLVGELPEIIAMVRPSMMRPSANAEIEETDTTKDVIPGEGARSSPSRVELGAADSDPRPSTQRHAFAIEYTA